LSHELLVVFNLSKNHLIFVNFGVKEFITKEKDQTSHLGRGPPLVGGGGFMGWTRNCLRCRK
jgi:hypothetical protein